VVKTYKELPGVEWVEGTGEFIKIDGAKCTGCANCIRVCLADCFEIIEQKARIKDLNRCLECGSCWYVCQENAIIFTWPSGGTGYKTDWG